MPLAPRVTGPRTAAGWQRGFRGASGSHRSRQLAGAAGVQEGASSAHPERAGGEQPRETAPQGHDEGTAGKAGLSRADTFGMERQTKGRDCPGRKSPVYWQGSRRAELALNRRRVGPGGRRCF